MLPCPPDRAFREAFTLLEALLSIALVALLLVLVHAGYLRVEGSAKGAGNLANHRVILRGLTAYASDHRSLLPWCNDLDAYPGLSTPWNKTLVQKGYIFDGRVFFNDKFWKRWDGRETALAIITQPERFPTAVRPWAYTTYGVNRYGAMPVSTDSRQPANLLKVAKDGNLSRLMLTRDVYQLANDTPSNRSGGGTYWFSGEGYLPPLEECYSGMVHAGFADGHVEAVPHQPMAEQLRSGTRAPVFHNVYTLP